MRSLGLPARFELSAGMLYWVDDSARTPMLGIAYFADVGL